MALFPLMKAKGEISPPTLAFALTGMFFLLLSFVTLRVLVLGDTFFVYRDLTWPTDNRDLLTDLFYSLDLESLRRSIYLGPIFAFVKLVGLSSLDAEKLVFLIIRFMTGFLSFIAIYKFLNFHVGEKNDRNHVVFLVSVIGAFFYAYNPVATTMVSPTLGFAFSYSLMPLTFYFFDKSLNRGSVGDIVITSALITLTLAGTTQFMVLLPLFVLLPWLAISLVMSSNRRPRRQMVKAFGFLAALVTLFSAYWILPALSASTGGIALEPQQYVLSTDFLDVVSSKISLDKVVRLMGDWWPRVEIFPLFDEGAWTLLTFAIPLAAISFVTFLKRSSVKYMILAFFLLASLAIFFNKGTQPPFSSFYPLLLDIPSIGWMFRIPSKFAMILAFATTMIVSLGFYAILSHKSAGIRRFIVRILPVAFLISVCIISWPMFTGDLGGVVSEHGYPPTPASAYQSPVVSVSSQDQNIAVVGGLEKADLVRHGSSLDSLNSIVFLDQSLTNDGYDLTAADNVIVDQKEDFFMHLLPEDAIVLSPFDATNRYSPKEVFSRARTDYALNGSFSTNYLDRLSINSRDLDFGHGLVFSVSDDSLELPFSASESGDFKIFVRYIASHEGGIMNVYLDGSRLGSISTLDVRDRFVWKDIGDVTLSGGSHVLALESLRGFNAINVLALVPTTKLPQMLDRTDGMLTTSERLIYTVGPDDFMPKGEDIGETLLSPVPGNSSDLTSYFEVVTIPDETSYMTAELLLRPSPDANRSLLRMTSLQLYPLANEDIIFLSDFESPKTTPPYTYDTEKFVLSTETSSPLSGKRSLKVNGSSPDADVISTELVSLSSARGVLNTRMFVSTDNVDYLDSKLVYFDENRAPISEYTVYTLSGDNPRTFYIRDINIAYNARFVQLQFLARMNPDATSSFILDVVTIEQRYPDREQGFEIFGNSRAVEGGFVQVRDDSVELEIAKTPEGSRTQELYVLSTNPIEVTRGLRYAFAAELEAENLDSVALRFIYFSHDAAKTSRFDSVHGRTLVLGSGQEVTANVEILRSSNHTIGILVGGCEAGCPSLKMRIGDSGEELVSPEAQRGELGWVYLTRYIPAGPTDLTITSIEGGTQLKGVVLFSDAAAKYRIVSSSMLNAIAFDGRNLDDTSTKVIIADYAQVNPTTFRAKIIAAEPFMLRLEMPYHSMWTAEINDLTYRPIRVYSPQGSLSNIVEPTEFPAINGFLIDRTGELEVIIKYEPHFWYFVGLAVTISAISSAGGYLIWQIRRNWQNYQTLGKNEAKETRITLPSTGSMTSYIRGVAKAFTRIEISTVPTFVSLGLIVAVAISLSFSLLNDDFITVVMSVVYVLFVVGGIWQFLQHLRISKPKQIEPSQDREE